MKEEIINNKRVIDVGALTPQSFCPHSQEENDDGTSRLACTLSGSHSGGAALRRKQQKQLDSDHPEK
jgi:hypothetical protein